MGNDIRGLAEFMVAKHRSGSTQDVKMRFVAKYAKFEDWDEGVTRMRKAIGKTHDTPAGFNTGPAPKPFPMADNSAASAPMPDILPDPSGDEIPF